jgi:hypothetical protein
MGGNALWLVASLAIGGMLSNVWPALRDGLRWIVPDRSH